MRGIRNHNLAQLLTQIRFTPLKQRPKQLEAAEKLLKIIDEQKKYPFEFVCYRITGFHPKGLPDEPLINGAELADDLRIFIYKLSARVASHVAEQNQKVYTIDNLARTFHVSIKTIDRWRKRGLTAKKFIFEDGRKRFGFLQSTVDEFISKSPQLTTKAKTFTRLTEKQKLIIIKQASDLAAKTPMSRYQIIEKVAAKIGRAHETVRYTIANYESQNPDKPVFKKPAGVITSAQASELYKLHKQGVGISELMARFSRSRSSVYRIINRRRAKAIRASKIEFVPSDEFLKPAARKKILTTPLELKQHTDSETVEPFDSVAHHLLPEYLQTLKDTPVLNRSREIQLFRKYNYLKYLACTTRAGMNPYKAPAFRLRQIEGYLAEAEQIKKMIIEANLRLVVSIAGKHTAQAANFSELVSKGNFALTKAVEEFDYTKDVRFARLASLNIAKEYARVSGKSTELTREKAASVASIQRDLKTAAAAGVVAVERARHNLVKVIEDNLDEREQYIILNHFGLIGSHIRKERKTLKQIGDDLKVSKERIRQIELTALQKLRKNLSPQQFELLTG